jgi:hypothetical protein
VAPRFVYLHGFASSPASRKAVAFAARFAGLGIDLEVPGLNPDGLRGLTLTGQLDVVRQAAGTGPSVLIGSSLGGYLAALYAARHSEVEKVVLLAPAFGFAALYAASLGPVAMQRWEREGAIDVTNYATGAPEPLGWATMADARRYEDEPALLQPCLIFHGVRDHVVPIQVSRAFARTKTGAELIELDSDHELTDSIDPIWTGMSRFLAL